MPAKKKQKKTPRKPQAKKRATKNPYVDIVIYGQATKTPQGWRIGRKTIPQGSGVVSLTKKGYYLDKSTGLVYAKKARANPGSDAWMFACDLCGGPGGKTKGPGHAFHCDRYQKSKRRVLTIGRTPKSKKSNPSKAKIRPGDWVQDVYGKWHEVLRLTGNVITTVKGGRVHMSKVVEVKKTSLGYAHENPSIRKTAGKIVSGVGKIVAKVGKKVGGVIAGKKENPKRRRNSGAESRREDFAGKVTGHKTLIFPDGTPQGLSTLGPLIKIETDSGDFKPKGRTLYLCQAGNGRLYLGATEDRAIWDGPAQNFGKVSRVEYECAKPHLGQPGKSTYFHDFESPLPELRADGKGGIKFQRGGYKIKREGIVG